MLTLFLLIGLLLAGPMTPLPAENVGGLAFRSYEAPVSARTSLTIGDARREVPFRDSLSLDFLLRIDLEREPFGSICHLLIDGQTDLGLVLIHDRDQAPGMLVNLGSHVSKPLALAHGLGEVNRISFGIGRRRDSLRIYANGDYLTSISAPSRRHSASVGFGAVGNITEIAPLILYEVSLYSDRLQMRDCHWQFTNAARFAHTAKQGRRLTAAIANPIWREEQDARWQPGPSFPISVPFRIAYGDSSCGLTFVSANEIVRIHPDGDQAERYPFADTLPIEAMGEDIIQDSDGGLYILDLEAQPPVPNRFDFERLCWERQERREAYSRSYESALLCNPSDGSVIRLFGYGYHRFLNEMVCWKPGAPVKRMVLEDVEPRRRSAFCVRDSIAFFYGGDGNESGRQDLTILDFSDILAIRLDDGSVRTVVESDALSPASPDLVFYDGRFHLLAYDSGRLVLAEINPETGECRRSPILTHGMTVYWRCRLLRVEDGWKVYIAGVAPGGNGLVKSFSIRDPYRQMPVASREESPWWPWLLLVLALLGTAALLWAVRRRDKPVFPQEDETETAPDAPQIRLLGFFKVTGPNGQDLTKEFSPMMQQLLAFLLLHCREDGRVSNAQLRENLWFDKSEESFNNNRAVYFNRIRAQLEKLGPASISSSAGNWSMEMAGIPCDYYRALELSEAVHSGMADAAAVQEFVHLAGRGPLLPDVEAEWLDRFKAEYAEKMITALSSLSVRRMSDSDRVFLSDLVLGFDSLDEEAVRMKCTALMESKRYGAAQESYKAFVQRYSQMMGEEFSTPFTDFVKKK